MAPVYPLAPGSARGSLSIPLNVATCNATSGQSPGLERGDEPCFSLGIAVARVAENGARLRAINLLGCTDRLAPSHNGQRITLREFLQIQEGKNNVSRHLSPTTFAQRLAPRQLTNCVAKNAKRDKKEYPRVDAPPERQKEKESISRTNANGVPKQSPGSRSAPWVAITHQEQNPNGVSQHLSDRETRRAEQDQAAIGAVTNSP
jgi:hypothetical protein